MKVKKLVKKDIRKVEKFLVGEEKDKRGELGDVIESSGSKTDLHVKRMNVLRHIARINKVHKDKPYVWGGYSFSAEECDEKGKQGKKQPAGSWREGQPIVPGVDCSGYVGKVLQAAGFDMPPWKPNCVTLARFGTKEGPVAEIAKKARPGDIIVIKKENGAPEHTFFYLGKTTISESAGKKQGVKEDNPAYQRWTKYAEPEKRGKTKEDMGGIQISDLGKYGSGFSAVLVPLEEVAKPEKKSYWNRK